MRDIKGNKNTISIVEGDINNNIDKVGNIVYGTQVINNPTQKQDEIKYDIKQGKLKLNQKVFSITGRTFSIVGFLGFISSIITILGSFKEGKIQEINPINYAFIFLFIIGLSILIFNGQLKKRKIISFFPKYIFGFEIGLFKDGTVGRLKIISNCPVDRCGGRLRFYYNENDDKYYFICSRNSSQHRFEFDFTSLEY